MDKASPSTSEDANSMNLVNIDIFKKSLSSLEGHIKLNDIVNYELRSLVASLSDEVFPLLTPEVNGTIFIERLCHYEKVIWPTLLQAILLGRWANSAQLPTLNNMLARLSDQCLTAKAGSVVWTGLRWYPVSLLMYAAGIAALSVNNFVTVHAIFSTQIYSESRRREYSSRALILNVVDGMLEVMQTNVWKCASEYQNAFNCESEHVFRTLKPAVDSLLNLGSSYESTFDRFEVLRTLSYVDLTNEDWGPLGRFADYRKTISQFHELKVEAERLKENWPPIVSGMYGGSYKRFDEAVKRFERKMLRAR